MAKKVLLIGGTRFLGKAIADAFIAKGYDVYAMNRGTKPPAKGVIEQIVCDKTDREAFAAVLGKRRWDIIVDTILSDDDLRFVVKTIGSNAGHFIHTGSLGVYGEARQIPAAEEMPLSEYEGEYVVFNQKIRQDQVITAACRAEGFPGTILRMSYIYGAGDIPLDGWGGRAPQFFKMLRDGETVPLPGDGRALLHPGHVRDLGRAFVHAAEQPASIGQIYNIGGHYALMTKDYIALVADAMGVKASLEYLPVREILARYPKITGERGMLFATQHMCASIAKAGRELGWRPEIKLETGLRENIEWMKKQALI